MNGYEGHFNIGQRLDHYQNTIQRFRNKNISFLKLLVY